MVAGVVRMAGGRGVCRQQVEGKPAWWLDSAPGLLLEMGTALRTGAPRRG